MKKSNPVSNVTNGNQETGDKGGKGINPLQTQFRQEGPQGAQDLTWAKASMTASLPISYASLAPPLIRPSLAMSRTSPISIGLTGRF